MYKDSFEKNEEIRREIHISHHHDCVNDRENCDKHHPNFERCVLASPSISRSQSLKPPGWRNWMLKPKSVITYFNRFTLQMENFNLSEVFSQMNSNGRLNVVHNIIENCLDSNERSLLFSDLKK